MPTLGTFHKYHWKCPKWKIQNIKERIYKIHISQNACRWSIWRSQYQIYVLICCIYRWVFTSIWAAVYVYTGVCSQHFSSNIALWVVINKQISRLLLYGKIMHTLFVGGRPWHGTKEYMSKMKSHQILHTD